MEHFVDVLTEISLGYIFSLPILIVLLKLDSVKNNDFHYKNAARISLSFVWIGSFSFGRILFEVGSVSSYFFIIWLFILLPVSVTIFILIKGLERNSDEPGTGFKRKFLGFTIRSLVILSLSFIISIVIITDNTIENSSMVLTYHNELMSRISKSDNPGFLLLNEAMHPVYMYDDIISNIKEISDNKAKISFALPWRIGIRINADLQDGSKYWELEYVRDNKKWKLEGLHSKGSIGIHNSNKN